MSRTITTRQAEILEYIKSRPIPPTYREICEQFGFKSTTAAEQHVNALCRKGLLTRVAGQHRSLEVV